MANVNVNQNTWALTANTDARTIGKQGNIATEMEYVPQKTAPVCVHPVTMGLNANVL